MAERSIDHGLAAPSLHKVVASSPLVMEKVLFPGLPTEFVDSQSSGPEFFVPSTALIGRLFSPGPDSAHAIFEKLYDCRQGTFYDRSVAEMLAARDSRLDILNIGCGGCSDILLLQQLLEEKLPEGVFLTINNCDRSNQVVQAVKEGTHPHLLAMQVEQIVMDPTIERRLHNYLNGNFVETGKVRFPHSSQATFPYDYYVMTETAREKLSMPIEASIVDLPYGDESQSIVMCFNVGCYLNSEEQLAGLQEVNRVLRPGGMFLSDGLLYQKQNDELALVSGHSFNQQRARKGVSPTYSIVGRDSSIPFEMLHISEHVGSTPEDKDLDITFTIYNPREYHMFVADGCVLDSPKPMIWPD